MNAFFNYHSYFGVFRRVSNTSIRTLVRDYFCVFLFYFTSFGSTNGSRSPSPSEGLSSFFFLAEIERSTFAIAIPSHINDADTKLGGEGDRDIAIRHFDTIRQALDKDQFVYGSKNIQEDMQAFVDLDQAPMSLPQVTQVSQWMN